MTRIIARLMALVLAFALMAHTAAARDLSANEQTALEQRINSFSLAIEQNDTETLIGVLPPKLLATMADQFGLEPTVLAAGLVDAMTEAMQSVELVSNRMDMATATVSQTAQGRTYVLIPTSVEMIMDGDIRMLGTSDTLAFADDGIWYLVNVDDPQRVRFLILSYPEFKGVEFPSGSIKIIED